MTAGIFDTAVDEWARVAAGAVRKIEFDLTHDGGGIVTMSSIVPISIYLPAKDVTLLQRTLLSSSALSGLIAQSTKFVRTVRSG